MGSPRISKKPISNAGQDNAIRYSYNDHEGSLTVNGFLVGAVGRKVDIVAGATTDTYTFSENGDVLYVLVLTFADATKKVLISAERTA